MSNRDHTRLHHMLDAALAAISHLSSRSRDDLNKDRLLLGRGGMLPYPPLLRRIGILS